MPIIATAGHVDHGKSTLVLALTGRDPDRWVEEKTRGLTIDLGFAWTTLGDHDVGMVDVPGHERFIKNMLAGMGAVDVALFVVAADEGWMPQSEEHLVVLDALDIDVGVVALTRIDLVDDELCELAIAETEERVAGTTLQDWPIVPVAAPQGIGLERLRSALADALDRAGPPVDIGRPRLWVDRAFTIEGAGLVVTGTLLDGSLDTEAGIELWPGPHPARVRSLQTHERSVSTVGPGSRVAVNIGGLDRGEIARGAMLAAPGTFRATKRLHARLAAVRNVEEAVANRGAYHLHAGSGHWPASLQIFDSDDHELFAVVRIAQEVPLRMGDRFILREVGRKAVVGGGIVLDPRPGRGLPSVESSRRLVTSLVGNAAGPLDRGHMAAALLQTRAVEHPANLDTDTGGGAVAEAVDLGGVVATPAWVAAQLDILRAAVGEYHHRNPMRPGIPKATLASQIDQPVAVLDRLLAQPPSGLEGSGPVVHAVGFSVVRSDAQTGAWEQAQAVLEAAGFAVPRSSTLALDPELFHALVRDGELILVADDLAYLPDQVERIIAALDGLDDEFTVAEFRDALGVSRRHAVPLLEWLDKQGVTMRRGDVRVRRDPQRTPPGGEPSAEPAR